MTDGDGAIVFRRSGLAIGEVYFRETPPRDLGRIDLLRIVAAPRPAPRRVSGDGHTLAVALALDEDRLFSDISADTRTKIRRATKKDQLEVTAHDRPDQRVVSAFCDTYDRFARSKALAPVFRPRLEALAATGNLFLSNTSTADGSVLVWHAYVAANARGHLLYSASVLNEAIEAGERNLIGRANRLLHWEDIMHFKKRGYAVLDLGGLDVAGRSEETTRIAQFKRSFGGAPMPVYSWSERRSVKGTLALMALRLRGNDF